MSVLCAFTSTHLSTGTAPDDVHVSPFRRRASCCEKRSVLLPLASLTLHTYYSTVVVAEEDQPTPRCTLPPNSHPKLSLSSCFLISLRPVLVPVIWFLTIDTVLPVLFVCDLSFSLVLLSPISILLSITSYVPVAPSPYLRISVSIARPT